MPDAYVALPTAFRPEPPTVHDRHCGQSKIAYGLAPGRALQSGYRIDDVHGVDVMRQDSVNAGFGGEVAQFRDYNGGSGKNAGGLLARTISRCVQFSG